jgi:hypothetical protein
MFPSSEAFSRSRPKVPVVVCPLDQYVDRWTVLLEFFKRLKIDLVHMRSAYSEHVADLLEGHLPGVESVAARFCHDITNSQSALILPHSGARSARRDLPGFGVRGSLDLLLGAFVLADQADRLQGADQEECAHAHALVPALPLP